MNLKKLFTVSMLTAAMAMSAQNAPKYVFFYIGDGMGLNPVNTAQSYNRDVLHNNAPLLMMQFPVASFCTTYSANSHITDSAAAGTALATGHKTNNGMLGVTPDTVAVTSVARQFKDAGYGVGIVTSVALDDATPSAYYTHVPSRKMHYDIDLTAVDCGYDFMAGAGLMGMTDANGDSTDVAQLFAQHGVQLVFGPEGINQINADKVVLLNNLGTEANDIGYTIDSIAGGLKLPLIAQTCINHLEKQAPDGFFMMCEGGNIDHALHGNDGGAAVKEILNFNEALAYAYDFYLKHPDETLIVVTADHDTGGSVNAYPASGKPGSLYVYDWQKVSKEGFNNYCKAILRSRRVYTWDDMQEYLQENLGLFTHITVNDETLASLKEKFNEVFEQRNGADTKTLYVDFNSFVIDVFKIVNDAAGVCFTTGDHSGSAVPVFAIGVGADRFKGMTNNIDLPNIIRDIMGFEQK